MLLKQSLDCIIHSWTCRTDSRFAPSQWETALLCNDVSHWLGANLESALPSVTSHERHGFSNHRQHQRSTLLAFTGHEGNPPVDSPHKRSSNAKTVSTSWSWRHLYQPATSVPATSHTYTAAILFNMMTSSNENIFRVTVPLCGKFTGHRWTPLTNASDAEFWCFLWSVSEKAIK